MPFDRALPMALSHARERLTRSGHPGLSGLLVLIGVIAALALSLADGARAQATEARWWESIPGFGVPSYTDRRPRPEPGTRRPDPLDDLRPDSTPMRSEVMVHAMEDAIARYQEIVNRGGWPIVPPGRMMRPGDDDERVPLLAKRLRMSGDLPRRSADYGYSGFGFDKYVFDEYLEAGVRNFQTRHGLRVTGRVDQPTFAALNVSAEARLAQLKLNYNRLIDLMKERVDGRYVLVNVPAFQLEAVDRDEVQLRHRVIVGRPERQTPSVKATIRALNFYPYWRVPDSIAQLDLIPRIKKEPDYLQKEGIRVYNGYNGPEIDPTAINWDMVDVSKIKFKQDPGPQNALGLVRLDMTNEHGVYMHDTPMKNLFLQRGRAFSAGCVRVQGVFQLVEWVAQNEPGWEQPGRVEEVVQSGQAFDLTLTHPVPVFFTYITAWAEPKGQIEFRPDIYGRDGSRELAGDRDPEAPAPPPSLAP